jgi:glucose-6-phosphate 1-dehydrogenase
LNFDIVFFGGTGDLTWRKLMPGLLDAHRHGALTGRGRILAVSRKEMSRDAYKEWLTDRFDTLHWDEPYTETQLAAFLDMVDYRPADLSDDACYKELAAWVNQSDAQSVVLYMATAPSLFETIAAGVAGAGLTDARIRLVLEKPLGKDLDSSTRINQSVSQLFAEDQIFRIDHYLGKQSVQNLMALRFGNAIFEPLWRRESISSVHITIAEDLGVGDRGGYYNDSGALRDMVQNHLLQLLCIVAMEPPVSDSADDIRDEKLKVLKSLRRLTPQSIQEDVVRGQYESGMIDGHAVPGYLEETGVPADSTTETYVAIKAWIDNWRWAGVPFVLQTGKRLAQRSGEIVINFRPQPVQLFELPDDQRHNRLVIQFQPDDTIEMQMLAKASNRERAEIGRLEPVKLDLDFKETFGPNGIAAYERLLRKLIAGRLDLFVRMDEQLAAWEWIMPVLDDWAQSTEQPDGYPAGSSGPRAAGRLIQESLEPGAHSQ